MPTSRGSDAAQSVASVGVHGLPGPEVNETAGRGRFRHTAKRVGRLLAILFAVSSICFFSLALVPGDPARIMLGDSATPASVAALRSELGLDVPVLNRFVTWLRHLVTGDLGVSYRTGEQTLDLISHRAPVTLELVALSQVLALGGAVVTAVAAAARRNTIVDRVLGTVAFGALAAPHFVIGFGLIWLFAVQLGWYPAGGYVPIGDGLGQHLGSLLLPAIALAAGPFALYQRVLRADLVETYGQEFIAVARAKGISPLRIAVRHAIRPSLLGLTTTVGVTVGSLIGGSVVVESLFSLPGLGAELVHAVNARDYVVVQGIVLAITAAFVVINALTDLLYPVIDPRIVGPRRPGRVA